MGALARLRRLKPEQLPTSTRRESSIPTSMTAIAPGPDTRPTLADSPVRSSVEPAGALFVGSVDAPDEYELTGSSHKGGEGVVFRARYRGSLPRAVPFAVKQLVAPPGIDPAPWPPPPLVDRWREQLKLLHLVHHEHLVGYRELIHGWPPHPRESCSGAPPDELRTWYLVMEWIDGVSLHELVRDGGTGLGQRLGYIAQIAAAVDYLHSGIDTAGMTLLHRDIKPGNVIVNNERGAVLVDYGLLRVEEPMLTELPAWTGPYLAPEVHANKTLSSSASDMWSIAATAFFAVTAEQPSPFDPASMQRQLVEHLSRQIEAPERLARTIASVLEAPPRDRPTSPVAWASQLTDDAKEAGVDIPASPQPTEAKVGSKQNLRGAAPISEATKKRHRLARNRAARAALVAVLAVGGTVAALVLSGDSPNKPKRTPSTLAPYLALPKVYATACPGEYPATIDPKSLPITCADGNTFISDITWTSWTTTRAQGYGTLHVNNCVPDCAGGTFHTYPTPVTLTTPVNTSTQGIVYAAVQWRTPDGSTATTDIAPEGCARLRYC